MLSLRRPDWNRRGVDSIACYAAGLAKSYAASMIPRSIDRGIHEIASLERDIQELQ